jgi:hypothetical protein
LTIKLRPIANAVKLYLARRRLRNASTEEALLKLPDVRVRPASGSGDRLTLLLPVISPASMSGGPNTALWLASGFAAKGLRLRLAAIDRCDTRYLSNVLGHFKKLTGSQAEVHIEDLSVPDATLYIEEQEIVLATAWRTAYVADRAQRECAARGLYFIQDFEPGLHPYSTAYALALATYDLPLQPIFNHHILASHFIEHDIGRVSHDINRITLNPAVDRSMFYPAPRSEGPGRLLFYARPFSAERNLFELGLAGLRRAVADGAFEGAWEFEAFGESDLHVDLGSGRALKSIPWQSFDNYAATMRIADIVLSLMLAPHPSYPPLEAAACGAIVVTTPYGSKTAARLEALSPNILSAPPRVDAIASALRVAVQRSLAPRVADLDAPDNWTQVIDCAVTELLG